jgi:hypothetical protein
MMRSLFLLAATATAAPYPCEVQHAYGAAAAYAPRGVLAVDPERADHKKLEFAPMAHPLVGANATAFADLMKADGVYRLRIRRAGARAWASASIRACDLAASGFAEDLSVQLDARGDVVALALRNARLAGCDAGAPAEDAALTSAAAPALDAVAQVIPVQAKVPRPPSGFGSVLPRDGGERLGAPGGAAPAGEHKERPPPTSFFRKYWHVILPLALLLITTSEPQPKTTVKKD